MPPKKQEQEPSAPINTWTILPIVFNSPQALEALKKPVTIKKALDKQKLIELLKQKGVEKYLTEGKLSREGQLFLCQNLNALGMEFLAQSRKPADPKKDQKKDSKKDSKKEQPVVEETQKPLEFDYQKGASQFMFYIDVPIDPQALQISHKNGLTPEVVVWIEDTIKQGSEKPNYDLLSNTRNLEDFLGEINTTNFEKRVTERKIQDISREKQIKKEALRTLQNIRMKKGSQLEDLLIIQVPFSKDLQHPESDAENFLSELFKRLCQLSLKKQKFQIWKKQQTLSTMVPTIKETIKKQVIVEQKKDQKKGGKKDPAAQPVTEIIEEVIQRKYESFPQNIKSDLKTYKRIAQQSKKEAGVSTYWKMLDDLAYSVSSSTQPHQKVDKIKNLSLSIWKQLKNRPVNNIKVENLRDKLPEVSSSSNAAELTFNSTLKSHPLPSQICLSDVKKYNHSDKSIQYEYKLQQFTQLIKKLGQRIQYTFENRRFVEKLQAKEINSRINKELQYDPQVYQGQCTGDGYNLLVLARVNPPGRVYYLNQIFDWKVLPNFQFWEQNFKDSEQKCQLWDYNWREAGNLKILNKKMMPTDNTVISEGVYSCGDKLSRVITLSKDSVEYGLSEVKDGYHHLWKQDNDLKTKIYTKCNESKSVDLQICLQRKEFTVLFNPHPTIYWQYHQLQISRSFGANGQLTKKLKNGNMEILYPNGDVSTLNYGIWTHIKNNKIMTEGSQQKDLKVQCRIQTDKKIKIRQDSTIFVTYANKDQLIVFKDGTIIKKSGLYKLEIKNPSNIVIRIKLPRVKDFNIIGSGSAFAYLGFSNIEERSYDGALYEFHHPTFSWHSYTEGIDRSGEISQEPVMLISYPDKSIMKIGDSGLVTFLNKAKQDSSESELSQRWIQLFTSPEYHLEGVYDVDLLQGEIRTKDAESNVFRVRIDGNGKAQIAVSFNIGSTKEQRNDSKGGFHVPEQNYFLPPPNNHITPKLFLIYPDGSGEEYLEQSQFEELRNWRQMVSNLNGRKIVQYSREVIDEVNYFCQSFSEKINPVVFNLPNLLEDIPIKPRNIGYCYNSINFRNIEEMEWNADFSAVKEIQNKIQAKRKAIKDELDSYRRKIK